MSHNYVFHAEVPSPLPAYRARASRIEVIIGTRETLLRRRLLDLLREQSDFEIVAECSSGDEAAEQMRRLSPDAMIVDASLPQLSALDAVRDRDHDGPPAMIVLASSMQDAQTALDLGALDCLLQPLERTRLERALTRVRSRVRREHTIEVGERLSGLLHALRSAADYPSRIPVVAEGRILFLDVDEIDWIEGSGNYVRIRSGQRCFRLRETLSRLESRLDPGRFRRVHRGAIVNVSRVRELIPLPGGAATLILEDGATLRMSRSHRDAFTWPAGRDPGSFEERAAPRVGDVRVDEAADAGLAGVDRT